MCDIWKFRILMGDMVFKNLLVNNLFIGMYG